MFIYKKNYFLFLLLTSLVSIFSYLSNQLINLEKLRYNFYFEIFNKIQVEQILEKQQKWVWLGYVIIPVLIFLRSSLVALCLSVGNFFYNIDEDEDQQPKFKQFFRIALYGEFVLLFVGVFKLLYFLFIKTDYTYPLCIII